MGSLALDFGFRISNVEFHGLSSSTHCVEIDEFFVRDKIQKSTIMGLCKSFLKKNAVYEERLRDIEDALRCD